MPVSNPLLSKRQLYLDVARTIAILSISINHAVNRSFANYHGQMAEFMSIPFAASVFKAVITVFSKLGVPLFLMITGALIMNKPIENGRDIRKFYKSNLLPLFITTEIWYLLMYWYLVLFDPSVHVLTEQGIPGALTGMVETMCFQNQLTFGSMWYMPMILCVYMILPFLVLIKNKLRNDFSPILLLPLAVLFCNSMVLPAINSFLNLQDQPSYTSNISDSILMPYYYLYILAGYGISKGMLSKIKTIWVGITAVGVFLLTCGYQLYAYACPTDFNMDYIFPTLLICAAFTLEWIRRSDRIFQRVHKPVCYLSRISFGIYFLHIIIMVFLCGIMQFTGWNPVLKTLFLEVASVGGSILLIAILSQVKLLRKYLFLVK